MGPRRAFFFGTGTCYLCKNGDGTNLVRSTDMTTGNEDNYACDRCFSGEFARKCDKCLKYPGPGDGISIGYDGSYFCSRCRHQICDDCGKQPGPGDSLRYVPGRGKSLCFKCAVAGPVSHEPPQAPAPRLEADPDAAVRCMGCKRVFDKSQLIPIRLPREKEGVPRKQIGVMCRKCYDEKNAQTAVYVKPKQCDFCKDFVGSGSLNKEKKGRVIKYRCGDPRCMQVEEDAKPEKEYKLVTKTADGEPLGALSLTMPSSVRERRAERAAKKNSAQKPQDSCAIS